MGSKADEMIRLAVQSLVERKPEIAEAVDALEHEVNLMHIEIDDKSLALLATQQPMAMDLRFLVTGMKINSELERIGDQAVNIAQHAQTIIQYPMLKPLIDLPVMADLAKKMVRESLDAYLKRDAIEAEAVIMQDDRVDGLKNQIFRELLTYMMSEPATIPTALQLILVSRNLERIGDQAVNIAEDVIYMALGRDVRHPREAKVEPQAPGGSS
jgi:phosphate transport system protein